MERSTIKLHQYVISSALAELFGTGSTSSTCSHSVAVAADDDCRSDAPDRDGPVVESQLRPAVTSYGSVVEDILFPLTKLRPLWMHAEEWS